LKAQFDPPIRERSGEARIPRVVVLGVTQEGFATLIRAERDAPGSISQPSRKPKTRRTSMPAPELLLPVAHDPAGSWGAP
jgi:hypothetical protein